MVAEVVEDASVRGSGGRAEGDSGGEAAVEKLAADEGVVEKETVIGRERPPTAGRRDRRRPRARSRRRMDELECSLRAFHLNSLGASLYSILI